MYDCINVIHFLCFLIRVCINDGVIGVNNESEYDREKAVMQLRMLHDQRRYR